RIISRVGTGDLNNLGRNMAIIIPLAKLPEEGPVYRMIIPVIMAGGVGSRLWPASREAKPKQFLRFGAQHSLFQQSLQRLQGLAGLLPPVVVCNVEHRFLVA